MRICRSRMARDGRAMCKTGRALMGIGACVCAVVFLVSATGGWPMRANGRNSTQTSARGSELQERRLFQEIQITGDATWVDTGIDVVVGERIDFSTAGSLRYSDAKTDNSPNGLTRGFKDLLRILPFNNAGRGASIGRIGDPEVAPPFLIGAKREVVAAAGGRLWVGINQASDDTGEGTYTIQIEVFPVDASIAMSAVRYLKSMPGMDNSLFSKIPRRIADKAGNPGDMVNFLIIGSQAAMEKVFTSAGWVKVDLDVKGTVLNGLIASMSKESYLTMPMSPLYLFGRTQDYGWARAEPIQVVASRNHLRIWKAPFAVNGESVWVGAATHDIGFARDQRNDRLTHKIDPDVDLEKNYVEKTLCGTGLISEVSHFLPNHPVQTARTATGGNFHSNGEVLVLKLVSPVERAAGRTER
jgi:LssY-like putative type I secretion system component LssY